MRISLGVLIGQSIDFVDVDAIGMSSLGTVPAPVSGDSTFWVRFGSEDCGITIDFTQADWEQFKRGIDTALASVEVSRADAAAEYAERLALSAAREGEALVLRQYLESQS